MTLTTRKPCQSWPALPASRKTRDLRTTPLFLSRFDEPLVFLSGTWHGTRRLLQYRFSEPGPHIALLLGVQLFCRSSSRTSGCLRWSPKMARRAQARSSRCAPSFESWLLSQTCYPPSCVDHLVSFARPCWTAPGFPISPGTSLRFSRRRAPTPQKRPLRAWTASVGVSESQFPSRAEMGLLIQSPSIHLQARA